MCDKSSIYQYASKGNWSSAADRHEVLTGIQRLESVIKELKYENAALYAEIGEWRGFESSEMTDGEFLNMAYKTLCKIKANVVEDLINNETSVFRLQSGEKRSAIFCQDAKQYANKLREGCKK